MLKNEISRAKKFNIALRAVTTNRNTGELEWHRNLLLIQKEFKVTLDENDKRTLLKKRRALWSTLKEEELHNVVTKQIANIFQFEKKERNDGKEVDFPTKKSAELLNESAELLGLLLKAFGVSTSQIRRYLDSLRRIKVNSSMKSFNESDVLIQQVKIAYAAGRDSDLIFLYEVMKPAITEGSQAYHCFEQLLRFVEAIVAYHRFYRGED